MRSGLHALGPTYPMIPHTLGTPSRACGFLGSQVDLSATTPETRKSPAFATSCVGGRSTELSSNESGNATTEVTRLRVLLSLRQNTDYRLRSGGADKHTAPLLELGVDALDLDQKGRRQLSIGNRNALLHLRQARHD